MNTLARLDTLLKHPANPSTLNILVARISFVCLALCLLSSEANAQYYESEAIVAPTSATELIYSPSYNSLVLKNVSSAIVMINLGSKASTTHSSTWNFTDMSVAPSGRYIFAADYGGENIGYGTPAKQHYVHRLDLSTSTWETKTASNAGNIQAVSDQQFILKSRDQWVTFTNNSWDTSSAVTILNPGSVYQLPGYNIPGYYATVYSGDFCYDVKTGRLLHGNSGLSSQEIQAFKIANNDFQKMEGSGIYGTAQGYGGTVALATDGSAFYYGSLQVDPLDVSHNLRVFPEPIYAATGDVAFGNGKYYDAHTGALLGSLGFNATVYGLNPGGKDFWVYDSTQSMLRHFSPPAVPDAPTNVVAVGGYTQAVVSFDAPVFNGGSAITGYTVTSSPAGGVDSNAGSTGTSHIVTGLINGTTYTFTVTANNSVGASAISSISNSVIPALTVPDAPTSVNAARGNAQAIVTFSIPLSNGGSAITGYTVTSSPAGGVDSNAGSTGTSHVVTGLTNGTTYTFTVTANNSVGASAASSPSNSVTPVTIPDAPTSVSAMGGNAQAIVNFSVPASNGGSVITGYAVTSIPAGGIDSNANSTGTSHIVTGLTNGTTYTFTVTANNSVGASAASSTSNSVIPAATVPGTPTLVNATGGNAQATVTFSAPVSNGGSAITGYTVTSNPAGGVDSNAGSIETSHIVTGLSNGTPYTFTVVATNSVGSGPTSLASNTVYVGYLATLNVNPSWNLLGNSVNATLDVATAFANATNVSSVWKWIPATSKWAFYTPSQPDGGAAYAVTKGYDFLTTINGGEGFWVNAKVGFTAQLPTGAAISTNAFADQFTPPNNLPAGWSLIAIGDTKTPKAFVTAINVTTPVAGAVPTSLTTLWAWDNGSASWYFYSPSLDNSGGLANYISTKGYLNFGGKMLEPMMGFWVNHP